MSFSPNVLACEEAIALISNPPQLSIQVVADLEQLKELWQIDKAAYQDCSLEFDEFAAWWRCYELGSRILLANGQIVASIGIYPLSEKQAIAFEQGEICEGDLLPLSIEECEICPTPYWYASGIVVADHLRGWGSPLAKLLRSGIGGWLGSGHIAYPLNLMAIAEYPIGARLLEFFQFKKVKDGSQLPDCCDLYKVQFDSPRQASSLVRQRLG